MKDQTITFAAICHIAHLVQQVSRNGQVNDDELTVLLNSIITTSPENTLAVYGGELANVKQGLELLINHLGDSSKSDGKQNKVKTLNLPVILLA